MTVRKNRHCNQGGTVPQEVSNGNVRNIVVSNMEEICHEMVLENAILLGRLKKARVETESHRIESMALREEVIRARIQVQRPIERATNIETPMDLDTPAPKITESQKKSVRISDPKPKSKVLRKRALTRDTEGPSRVKTVSETEPEPQTESDYAFVRVVWKTKRLVTTDSDTDMDRRPKTPIKPARSRLGLRPTDK